jgi:LUD domain
LRSRIPPGASVMNGGSATLEEIGFLELLASGRYRWLRPAIAATNERAERLRRRREAVIADWLVGGANAVTQAGEIVNVDGSGNRLAGYAFGAGKVILVAGVNKVVPDLAAALDRTAALAAGGTAYVLPTYTAMLDLQGVAARRGLARPYWEEAAA